MRSVSSWQALPGFGALYTLLACFSTDPGHHSIDWRERISMCISSAIKNALKFNTYWFERLLENCDQKRNSSTSEKLSPETQANIKHNETLLIYFLLESKKWWGVLSSLHGATWAWRLCPIKEGSIHRSIRRRMAKVGLLAATSSPTSRFSQLKKVRKWLEVIPEFLRDRIK